MGHQVIGEQASLWLEPVGRRLRRALARSARLRLAIIGVTSVSGTLLLLSPATILVFAGACIVYLSNHIQGPLDLFIIATLVAVSLLAVFVCVQLSLIKPLGPDGIDLTKEAEPELFAMLERRVSHFRTGAINRVVLCTDAQLRIDATPRLPLPFFRTYSLCVGAPLMFFLSHGQFRLALAGTIGTSVRGQNGLTGWIRQSPQDWSGIVEALEHDVSFSARLMIQPARWIASATATLSSDLNTDVQQAQGRWVLENADEQAAMDFLASQVVACAFLDKLYWPMIYKTAQRSASPVAHPFSYLPLLLRRLLDVEQSKRWLLQAQAGNDSGQTGLRDILASLNLDHLSWPGLPAQNAYSSVFRSPDPLKTLDKHWQRNVETDWKRRYKRFQQDRKRFERLHHEAGAETLHGDSAARYVKLAKRFLDKTDVVSAYLSVYHNNLNDAGLCMLCGQELLASGHSREGYAALQRACELEPALSHRAQDLMRGHREAWLYEPQPIDKQAHSG